MKVQVTLLFWSCPSSGPRH